MGSHSSKVAASPKIMEFLKNTIASSEVVVWSKSYCPYCARTKNLLSERNIDAKVFELDQMDNGAELQAALLEMSGQRTVPNVFVKGEHLGGSDDTQAAARSGKLDEMLK